MLTGLAPVHVAIWFKVRSCCLYEGDMTNGPFGKATLNQLGVIATVCANHESNEPTLLHVVGWHKPLKLWY